jgi:radical SAM protein with 4Fe4S-binding SPASM domain
MTSMVANLLLGRVPSYTRKARHLQLLQRYGRPAKLLNLARAELARARGDVVVGSRPYVYTVDTGNYCNLRCPLCPTGYHGLERPQAVMSLESFNTILGKIRPYAIEVILHNWGEPFLNPEILPIIRSAKSAGIGTTISSNLNLVHRGDDFLREVVESGLDHLTVSLDGTTQEVYETYRKGGELEAVLHNMRVLLEHRAAVRSRTPVLEWQFLVMKHNEHQIADVRRMAREMGVDQVRLTSPGMPFDKLTNVRLADQWISENPEYRHYHPEKIFNQGYLYAERCFYLYRAMTINPKGEVSPCCAVFHGKWDFGNLLDSSLAQVWNNPHYRSARGLFSRKKADGAIETVCHRCPLFRFESARAN